MRYTVHFKGFIFAKCITSTDTDDIAEFLDESIKGEFRHIVKEALCISDYTGQKESEILKKTRLERHMCLTLFYR